jgi:diaminopimelate decarboxylase
MIKSSEGSALRMAELLNKSTPRLTREQLEAYVQRFLGRRHAFIDLVEMHGAPLYAFDRPALVARGREFMAVFKKHFPTVQPCYAVKSNHYPEIARTLVGEGYGLDVSSGEELKMALEVGAKCIIFSGPGKTEEELELAVGNGERIVLMLDSLAELRKLERIASNHNRTMRCGVRLTTVESGIWRKFGTPLESLPEFFRQAESCGHVRLAGVQFHISWNLNPDNQVRFIVRLGAALKTLAPKHRAQLEFLDIGGGFWPPAGEWMQPTATPEGMLHTALSEPAGSSLDHFCQAASPLTAFAEQIERTLAEQIPSDVRFSLYCEPGRWLCHEAMHILIKVEDRKAADLVITDAGTNAVGWDRFESDYFPVINLTRPSLDERECLVAGSLCTPHDIWGYAYFGEDIQPGDLLLIPDQGAYTFSLRQNFIKPLPKVAVLNDLPDHPYKSGGDTV